jgi:hypothetical protein
VAGSGEYVGEGPPDTYGHARHARHAQSTPVRQNVVAVLLGVSWFAGTIAAYLIGGSLAYAIEPAGAAQEPSTGPDLVGIGGMLLAFLLGAQISLLRDRRRHPKARYKALHGWRYRTIDQALRHNLWVIPAAAGFIVVGLYLAHHRG